MKNLRDIIITESKLDFNEVVNDITDMLYNRPKNAHFTPYASSPTGNGLEFIKQCSSMGEVMTFGNIGSKDDESWRWKLMDKYNVSYEELDAFIRHNDKKMQKEIIKRLEELF